MGTYRLPVLEHVVPWAATGELWLRAAPALSHRAAKWNSVCEENKSVGECNGSVNDLVAVIKRTRRCCLDLWTDRTSPVEKRAAVSLIWVNASPLKRKARVYFSGCFVMLLRDVLSTSRWVGCITWILKIVEKIVTLSITKTPVSWCVLGSFRIV